MGKYKGIKYNFSGMYEDFFDLLRKYSVSDTLKKINRESRDLLNNKSELGIRAAKRVSFNMYKKGSTIPEKIEAIITAWSLIDLAYYLMKFSNDYRGKNIECDEELYLLQVAVDTYKECNEYVCFEKEEQDINDRIDFFMYVWGFAGEQFKAEAPELILDNQSRDLYMLFEINNPREFDMVESLKLETGLSWQMIASYLTMAWFGFMQKDSLEEVNKLLLWKKSEYRYEFEKLIERYTTNYDDIRKSVMGRQLMYAKPYVRTQKGEVISVSAYLNFFLCEHSILWIIRDRFNKSQDFTNYFGGLFEKYFEELLCVSLKQGEYERIPEGRSKRADWRLHIGEYKILVEQKSTIMRLSAKQQEVDVWAIKDFAKRTVIKAMSQLENTEREFADGKYIKIILLYEDYIKPELIEQIMLMPECKIENDNYYWIATISELEMLFTVAKNDRKLFEEIIREKIDREINHSIAGKSLGQILNEKGVTRNEYIRQDKFMKYRKEVNETAKSLLI